MADITKCYGDDCPIKNKCYRYTAFANYDQQSYFTEIPGKTENGKFTCEMYWGVNNEAIWNQLKDITNGKDNTDI
jgi:hypothetical protein